MKRGASKTTLSRMHNPLPSAPITIRYVGFVGSHLQETLLQCMVVAGRGCSMLQVTRFVETGPLGLTRRPRDVMRSLELSACDRLVAALNSRPVLHLGSGQARLVLPQLFCSLPFCHFHHPARSGDIVSHHLYQIRAAP